MLIWKAFQNTEEWRFSFWNIFFRFRDIDIFLLCSDDVIRFATKKWKILNKRYLWKYWSRNKMTPLVLLPWQQFCRWWCVNKNRNSQFCQKPSTPPNLMMEMKTIFRFFFDANLWCQVSRILLQYFQRYRLFSIFHFFVANRMTSSLHNRKMSISLKQKKIFQKEKRHSSLFWKAFQISTKIFSFHRHFKGHNP